MSVGRGRGRARHAALLLALVLAGCDGAPQEPPPPSLLLVTIDTLRADAVSAWGREPGLTPRLDALCAAGTRFSEATTVTPLTLPAHASLFTGLRPARHGLTVNGVALPRLPVPTLAQRLHDRRFATAAFVSSTVLDHRFGLAVGFDSYDDDLFVPGGVPVPTERRGDVTVDHALRWGGFSAGPWFVWVHLFDPHAPYGAPGQPPGTDRAAYLREVAFADAQLGRLLDGVRAQARGPVLVVVAADHGEGLGEHGEQTHGLLLEQTTLHVPLALAWLDPGEGTQARPPLPGTVRDDVVSLLDLTPTVLELLGLPLPTAEGAALDGRSVLAPQPHRALPLETRAPWFYYGFSPLAGVRRDALKLVGAPDARPPDWTLSDLAVDPLEEHTQVVTDDPLQALVLSPRPEVEAVPAGDAEALTALGYVGRQAPSPRTGEVLADPRDELALIAALDRANTELVEGRPQAALDVLATLPARDLSAPELLLQRGRAYAALERWDEALADLQQARSLRPTADLDIECAHALIQQAVAKDSTHWADGVAARAAQWLDAALRMAPEDPRAQGLRALTELRAGAADAALARLSSALARRPRDIQLLSLKLQVLRETGREAESRAVEDELRTLWPEHPALAPPR